VKQARTFTRHTLTLVCVLAWISPFFYMLNASLKSEGEFDLNGPLGLPAQVAWDNFQHAATVLIPYFLNSVRYVLISVPTVIVLAVPAAYAIARMDFRFRIFISTYLMIGFMFSLVVWIIPLYILYRNMGLLNSIWPLVISYVTSQLAYSIYLLRGYMAGIPRALEEAAFIDGASALQVLWYVIVPLSKPMIFTVALVDFFATWNDFFIGYTFQQSGAYQPLQLSLFQFQTTHSTLYTETAAALILMVLPTLFIFLVFQPYIMRQARAGAIKE